MDYNLLMSVTLEHAMTAAANLTKEDQEKVAQVAIDEAKRLSILEGLADVEAGRVVPHNEVKAWLESWGTDHELPPPSCR